MTHQESEDLLTAIKDQNPRISSVAAFSIILGRREIEPDARCLG
jgi:hypothetical protein